MGQCASCLGTYNASELDKSHKSEPCTNKKRFTHIWPRVRGKIWRLTTQKDRASARNINLYFKHEIELTGGLHTKLTYKDPLCLQYLENVETTRFRFADFTDEFFDFGKEVFRCKYNIRKVDIVGMLSYKIFRDLILPLSKTLRYMEFRQISLMTRYVNPSPNDDIFPHEFAQLVTLTFHYGTLRRGEPDNFQIFNANMIYLLRLINAPKLEVFNVHPVHSVLTGVVLGNIEIPHNHLHWEGRALKTFITRHRRSLRKLSIVLYRNKLSPENDFFVPPKHLTDYSCLIPRLRPQLYDIGDPDKPLFQNYWTQILNESRQLKSFCAQVENWGRSSRFRIDLRKVMKNNYSTLTKILINSYHTRDPGFREHHLTLDMGVFSICIYLKVLHIRLTSLLKFNKKGQSESETYTAIGLEKLPSSLESLQFKNILCYSTDLQHITKLNNLTSIQLLHAGRKGTHGVTFDIAKALFIHKTIKYVEIFGFNEERNPARIMALVKKFNNGLYEQHVQIRNPLKKIPFFDHLPCCCCMREPGGLDL